MGRLFERPRVTVFLAVLISLTLITLNFRGGSRFSFVSAKGTVRDVVSPLRSALNTVFHPVSDVVSGMIDYGSVQKENERLRLQIQGMKGQQYRYQSEQRQLSTLLSLQKIPYAAAMAGTDAQVVNFTPSNLQLSFEIDKGSTQGIKLGNPVVTGSGLAGRVVAVASNTATVLMLTDPSFAVGVRIDSAGTVAIAEGQGVNQPVKVSLVTPGTKFQPNQILTTSGLQNEIFPPGIPVGRVTSATNPAGALEENVNMAPIVNYATLQYVRVLFWVPVHP